MRLIANWKLKELIKLDLIKLRFVEMETERVVVHTKTESDDDKLAFRLLILFPGICIVFA